jgi:hypothetical protein
VHHIESHFSKKEFTACAFIDIKSAFDSAWHPTILSVVILKNCPSYLVRIIKDYLSNRKAFINIDGHEFEAFIETGCPQGGILSAFLWTILIDDVFNILLPFPIFILAYADDLTIACSHALPSTASLRLNISCKAVVDWLFSLKLLINPPKTIFMLFKFRQRERSLPDGLSLNIQETVINPSTSTTVLGFHIDDQLNWKKHIELKCISTSRLLFAIRHYLSLTWGLNRSRLQYLYKLIVEPTILYGCPVWVARTSYKVVTKNLRSFQGKYAILILRAFRTTQTEHNINFSLSASKFISKVLVNANLLMPYDRAKCICSIR